MRVRPASYAAGVLLALGAVVSGCGGGSEASRLRASGPITKAEATSYANNVNLDVADVPGMTSESLEGETKRIATVRVTCGQQHIEALVRNHSPRFGRHTERYETVESDVDVYANAALAKESIAGIPGDRRCLLRAIKRGVDGGLPAQDRAEPPRVSLRPALFPGMEPTLRVVHPFTLTDIDTKRVAHTHVYTDTLAFVAGPALIKLVATSSPHPPAITMERRLLSLLYHRTEP
jgi:hypothetical protein